MMIQLSESLEFSIRSLIQSGLFASVDDAMAEAARLLLQRQTPSLHPISPTKLDQLLLDLGLMSELPDTAADFDDPDDLPTPIQGEPLSETVIRERR